MRHKTRPNGHSKKPAVRPRKEQLVEVEIDEDVYKLLKGMGYLKRNGELNSAGVKMLRTGLKEMEHEEGLCSCGADAGACLVK